MEEQSPSGQSRPLRCDPHFLLRHQSEAFGLTRDYTFNDRFFVLEGEEDGETFLYPSGWEKRARIYVAAGDLRIIAEGVINAKLNQWTFNLPLDPDACRELLPRIMATADAIRYYGEFTARCLDGEILGVMRQFHKN